MNAEQKQRATELVAGWRGIYWRDNGNLMAALLQELVDAPEAEPFAVIHLDGSFVHVEFKQTVAGTGKFEVYAAPPVQSVPEPEPFGYFKSEPFGWTDCAETDDGAIALYTAPSEPEPVARVTGYYAGHTTIITLDGRVLPAGTALYAAPPHQSEHHLEMVNTPAPTPAEPPADLDAPEFSDGCEKEGFPGGCARMGCCKQLPATANPARTSSSQIEPPAELVRDAEPWKLLLENLVEGLNKTYWSSWQGTAHFDEYLREAISAIERDKLKGQS